MNEKYLHFIWKNKRLPLHQIQTIDGREIQILDVGVHNHQAGPDFFNGKIKLEGVVHQGNIEIHVKSSDWNLHKHQLDPAYNNVILHVVYLHDELIFVEGFPLPTIQLKDSIDWSHFKQFSMIVENTIQIPCQNLIQHIAPPIVWLQVQNALFQRLDRKSKAFPAHSQNIQKTLFQFIAKGFGLKTNELPFEELANRIPFEKFIRANKRVKLALTFGVSGFLDGSKGEHYKLDLKNEWDFQKHRLNLQAGKLESWKFKGCRPKGFPTIRLAQFAHFADTFDWSATFWELPVRDLHQYLIQTLTQKPGFVVSETELEVGALTKQTANIILINSVVPFLWWLSHFLNQEIYQQKAIELLECLPAENHIRLDHWKTLGITPKTAADSQGLLELQDTYCVLKKCLNCAIGDVILK